MARAVDTLIIGAGAAGMMCAAHAAGHSRRSILVIDHANVAGEKIRISGGGRCNFTNRHTGPLNFLSQNPHFAKSALGRYTPRDFISLIERHGIAYHEKTLGQLFCDGSATQIIAMLKDEMAREGAVLQLETEVADIARDDSGFCITLSRNGARETVTARHLVIACGGKSIPKMGATGLGYQIAERFGHAVTETRPALVPLTFSEDIRAHTHALSGIAVEAAVGCGKVRFREALLFTHRGLSGPSILQISSYWREKMPLTISLVPAFDGDVYDALRAARAGAGGRTMQAVLTSLLPGILPKNLVLDILSRCGVKGNLADQPDRTLRALADLIQNWTLTPVGTEGYRTAEVTLGGVSTAGLHSRSMESKTVPGLYFIGEVVDVTGWLGGYNFQWAWASAVAAGRAIAQTG